MQLEDLETAEATEIAEAQAEARPAPVREPRARPKRKLLPEHLPRQEVVHEPAHDGACACPACGATMGRLGEDVTEVLDYIPGRLQVIRHVRPKYACARCAAVTQAPAPPMPTTPRGRATPGLLSHLVVAKYLDHQPLYRQSAIYARAGLELDRSTLADWVGQVAWLMQPIAAGIRAHVFAAEKIHGDDTTMPVLEPGLGRTKSGRLWVYVRDDRPFAGIAPLALHGQGRTVTAAAPPGKRSTRMDRRDGVGPSPTLPRPPRHPPGAAPAGSEWPAVTTETRQAGASGRCGQY